MVQRGLPRLGGVVGQADARNELLLHQINPSDHQVFIPHTAAAHAWVDLNEPGAPGGVLELDVLHSVSQTYGFEAAGGHVNEFCLLPGW